MKLNGIDLIYFNQRPAKFKWDFGNLVASGFSIDKVNYEINQQKRNKSDWILFWDFSNGEPNIEYINTLISGNAHIYHAGLLFGLDKLPSSLDYILPNWVLILNADSSIQSTSWKITPRACLINYRVINSVGLFDSKYNSLDYAFLDYGFKSIQLGIISRYDASLLSQKKYIKKINIIKNDELYFIKNNFSSKWQIWAMIRICFNNIINYKDIIDYISIFRSLPSNKYDFVRLPLSTENNQKDKNPKQLKVSIIIPTLNRYKYLNNLLIQLNIQDILPFEVMIIDQTSDIEKENIIIDKYENLNLIVLYLDQPGQSTARNLALQKCSGDYVLFCDDDIEVEKDFIKSHLQNICKYNEVISCGTVTEVKSTKRDERVNPRVSAVFPGGNTLLPKKYLFNSGLFDAAFDRGMRADKDLGIRLYLSGYLLLLDPTINVLHHKADIGGLRMHNQRKITYAESRKNIFHINLPSISDFYISFRYFSDRQHKEMFYHSILGLFAIHGQKYKIILQSLFSLLLLPIFLGIIYRRRTIAKTMLNRYPEIPVMEITDH